MSSKDNTGAQTTITSQAVDTFPEAFEDIEALQSSLCEGCRVLDFANEKTIDESYKTAAHPGFASMNHLQASAEHCNCCAYIYDNLVPSDMTSIPFEISLLESVADTPWYVSAHQINMFKQRGSILFWTGSVRQRSMHLCEMKLLHGQCACM